MCCISKGESGDAEKRSAAAVSALEKGSSDLAICAEQAAQAWAQAAKAEHHLAVAAAEYYKAKTLLEFVQAPAGRAAEAEQAFLVARHELASAIDAQDRHTAAHAAGEDLQKKRNTRTIVLPNGLTGWLDNRQEFGDLDRLFVKLKGSKRPAKVLCFLDMNLADTVSTLAAKIAEKEGIPPNEIILAFRGTRLQRDMTLAESDIYDEAMVHATVYEHMS